MTTLSTIVTTYSLRTSIKKIKIPEIYLRKTETSICEIYMTNINGEVFFVLVVNLNVVNMHVFTKLI